MILETTLVVINKFACEAQKFNNRLETETIFLGQFTSGSFLSNEKLSSVSNKIKSRTICFSKEKSCPKGIFLESTLKNRRENTIFKAAFREQKVYDRKANYNEEIKFSC
jgi:hypothetical protein